MNALDQQDAIMQGVAQYMEWKRQFLSEWRESLQRGQIKQAFAMMPPEMKEWLKKNDPKGYKQVMDVVGGNYAEEV